MQENEFEKRMRQEMGEFRLRPSETVWEKVEEQLKRKKRRRVVFFIFMLAAGLSLLGYSGYFLTKTNSTQNLVQQDNNSLPGNNKPEPVNKQQLSPTIKNEKAKDQPVIKEYTLPPTKERDQGERVAANVLNNDKVVISGNDIAGKQKEKNRKISSGNYPIAKSTRKSDFDITKAIGQQDTTEVQIQNDPSDQSAGKAIISQPGIAKNDSPYDNKITDIEEDGKTIDKKINETIKPDSAITAQSKASEAIAATKKKQPASKIKWGIDLSVGITANRTNAFSIFGSDKSLAMDYYSPGTATGGGLPNNNIRISPSGIKAGPALRAGLLGEIGLSKRSSISSGLQYVYYSNKIQVGYYSDTTVLVNNSNSQVSRFDAIYRGTQQNEYINRYHFIQIPIQYQLQLNKGDRLLVLWDVGVSAGYLFATNGLVYDTTAGGIYYRDNAAFNKFQLNLNTGVSFRFGKKNKVQWSLGPGLSMGMNKLMKDEYTKKQYLLYGGLTGRLYFKKRNNK